MIGYSSYQDPRLSPPELSQNEEAHLEAVDNAKCFDLNEKTMRAFIVLSLHTKDDYELYVTHTGRLRYCEKGESDWYKRAILMNSQEIRDTIEPSELSLNEDARELFDEASGYAVDELERMYNAEEDI